MNANILMAVCPFCSSTDVNENAHTEYFSIGRKKYSIPGILSSECSACGEEFATAEQHDQNLIKKKEFTEKVQGFITPGFIRKIREKFGISQRSASKIFGAGESSVAKWESGQVPSGPAALLLQCSAHVPGVVEFLASLAEVEIEDCPDELKWVTFDRPRTVSLVSFRRTINHHREAPKSMYIASEAQADYTFDEINGIAA